jgi:cytochrome c biogenesis protein CcdA
MAGLLSILSPCVLPLAPVVVGAALGSESGVTVGGSAVAGVLVLTAVPPVPVVAGSAVAVGVGTAGVRRDMPRYTPPAAATSTSGTASRSTGKRFLSFGSGIGGGRIDSGTRMPAAFVMEARTPLVWAPCASSAM